MNLRLFINLKPFKLKSKTAKKCTARDDVAEAQQVSIQIIQLELLYNSAINTPRLCIISPLAFAFAILFLIPLHPSTPFNL